MSNLFRILAIYTVILALLTVSSCTTGKSQTKKNFPNKYNDNNYKNIYAEENNEFNDNSNEFSENSDEFSQLKNEDNSKSNKNRYFQKGYASWYGREYHGKETASGEKFDMHKYTAAHKTLPFGTIVKVKNLGNGKFVRVKINERGPYQGKRIIDLSYSAAKRLEILGMEKVMVGLNIISGKKKKENYEYSDEMDSNVEPVADDRGNDMNYEQNSDNYTLQVGAFYSKRNARKLKEKVEELTNSSVKIIREGDLYKVRLGGLPSKNESRKYKKILEDEEIPSYILNNR